MSQHIPRALNPLAEDGNYRRWVECARKRGYGSRKIAQGQATGALKRWGRKLGFYRCEHCNLWHLFTER